jgi:hypothetical protein
MVVLFNNAVRGQVPHLGVALVGVCELLLHAQESLPSLVFAIAHRPELGNRLFDRSVAVGAAIALASIVGSSTLVVDLLAYMIVNPVGAVKQM